MGLREEGLRAYGSWEPLAHHLQNGGAARGAEACYAWEHSEAFIRGLHDRGFNLYITHFSKGYGIEAEAESREDTRRVAELCHGLGMYVGGYIRYSTFIPNTLGQEVPDCIERFGAVTAEGTHPRYNTQYWRYLPCPTSTAWLEYLDRLIGIGMDELGLDCLHVDGLGIQAKPFACCCARCREGFRDWLRARYPSAEAQKARFGFAGLACVEPPAYPARPGTVIPRPMLDDPIEQEWVLYGCRLVGGTWQSLVNSARRRNPDCVVQGNGHFYPDFNNAWFQGTALAELDKAGADGFFSEEGSAPNLTPDGRLHGYFETFKKLRQRDLTVFAYNRQPVTHGPFAEAEPLKRAMAHQMAFNRDSTGVFCARLAPDEWPFTVPEYLAFHRDRRDLFQGTRQAHDAAIYYSERTRALNCGTHIATQAMARDVLMRSHVPFGFLAADRREAMPAYAAMILPEVECLDDGEIADLAAYVRAGGGLLIVGANTGRYTDVRRLRETNGLDAALGLSWNADTPAFSSRIGTGRVAFMPGLMAPEGTSAQLVARAVEESEIYFGLNSTQWRPAVNGADLVRQLAWAANGFSFEPLVPDTVVVEFVHQAAQDRHLLHFVNFDLERDVGPFEILCCNGAPTQVETFTPDGDPPAATVLAGNGDAPAVHVDGMRRYLIVALR